MWVRHSYRLISKQIFIEKCSWDTKWMNKWDSHQIQAQDFIKHCHTKMGWVKNIKKSLSCSQEMAKRETPQGHREAPHPSAQSIRSDSVGTVSLLASLLLTRGKNLLFFFFSTEVSFLMLQKESTTWFLKSQFRNQSAHQAHRWRARRAKTISRAPWSFPRIEENYLIQQYNTSQQHKSNGGDLTLLYTLKLRILVCLHGHVWGEWPWWYDGGILKNTQ